MQKTTINNNLLATDLDIIVSQPKELAGYFKGAIPQAAGGAFFAPDEQLHQDAYPTIWFDEDFLRVNTGTEYGTSVIVHEIFHFLTWLLPYRGIPLPSELAESELLAYCLSYYIERVLVAISEYQETGKFSKVLKEVWLLKDQMPGKA